jgi:signal transduction histidine kinase
MQRRAEAVGGSFGISSGQSGTTVTLELPLA